MHLICLQPSPQEPVSVGEVKTFLRIDHDVEDALLAQMLQMARATVEEYTQRSLLRKTWRLTAMHLPAQDHLGVSSQRHPNNWSLTLARAPFIQLLGAPKILTSDVDPTDVDDFQVCTNYDRVNILFDDSEVSGQTLQVDFEAGYGEEPESIPPPLRQAVLLLLADFYQNRDITRFAVGVNRVQELLQPYLWMALH